MTKKHFIALAKAIQDYRLNQKPFKHEGLATLANAIANVCQESNSNFDREKFLGLALRADIE